MDGKVVIQTELDTKSFDKEITYLEDKLEGLEQEYEALKSAKPFEGQELELYKIEKEAEKTKNKLVDLYQKQNKMNKEGFKGFSDGVKGAIAKIGKWGLALLGVRSMYSAITSAMSIISQYDTQLSTDLEYIKYSLAMTIKPIIEWLVSAISKILQVTANLIYAMTGYNIFANSSAEAFASASKSANEIKKSLAGFDEMNVLSDTSSSSTTSTTPSIDLSIVEDEAKSFSKTWRTEFKNFKDDADYYIEDNWETIKKSLLDSGWTKTFVWGIGVAVSGAEDIFNGFIDFFGGLWEIISGIIDGDSEVVIQGLKDMVVGLWEFIWGTIKTAFGLVVGIVGQIVIEVVGSLVNIVTSIVDKITYIHQVIVDWLTEQGKEFYTAVKEVFSKIWEFISGVFKSTGEDVKGLWNILTEGGKNAWEGIKETFSNVGDWFKDTFTNAWNKVKEVFSTGGKIFDGIKDGIVNGFKAVVNKLIDGINKVVSTPFSKINDMLNDIRTIEILGVKPFKSLWSKNPISVPKIPHLAVGGIVNMPSKGVFTGGALVGERGPEGVIPLTNSEMMEQLGATIGKYININLTNVTKLDSRQIAKEQKKINNQIDFAFNR